ncbi:MAG: CotH kinase family protein [Bacteroidota bacterium]
MKKAIFLIFLFAVAPLVGAFAQMAEMTEKGDGFYNPNNIHELRLNFEQGNWAYLLDSIRIHGDGMLIGDAKVDGKNYENAGIRYRGSKSFTTGSKRNAFHIKLNYINKNQNHQGYKTLKLSNALRDPSMIREVLSYEIARQYLPAPQAGYVNLYINDEYFGLFVNVEAVNGTFLEKHFGSKSNSFFKCSPDLSATPMTGCKNKIFSSLQYEENVQCYTANYEMKSDEGWDDLIELTNILNNEPDKVSSVLNVDRTLWMLAFNNVLVNLSSYSGQHSHNFYLYKDNFGRFNPIVWDMNLAFGSFKNTGKGSDLKLAELQKMDPLLHADNPSKPLIAQLLRNPEYKKMYLSHLRTILYDHFVNGNYEKRAKELQATITSAFYSDPNKFYQNSDFVSSLKSTIGRRSKIPGIVELMSSRARFLKKHPEVSIYPPEVEEVKVLRREQFAAANIKTFTIQAKVKNRAKRVKIYYRSNADDLFTSVFMADDGKSGDGEPGDKIFGVTIDPKGAFDTIQYYIVTENAKATGFDPPNYMFEPYTASIQDLNK